jgi:hypothetical protein
MVEKSGSGSAMINPDHISESLETIFLVKILKFFDVDPGSVMGKFGSGINILILDPQHCVQLSSRSSLCYFLICTVRNRGTVSYSSHVKTKIHETRRNKISIISSLNISISGPLAQLVRASC